MTAAPECAHCSKLCLTKGEATRAASAWNQRETSQHGKIRGHRMEAYRCPVSTWWHMGNNRPRNPNARRGRRR